MPNSINYNTRLTYGLGVDSSSEQARGMAVIPTEPKNLRGASGASVVYSTHFCDNQRSLEETLGVSAAMSVSYGFVAGGSAKVDFAQSKVMTAHSQCVVVKVLLTNPVLYMENIRLSADARDLYARDPNEFKARFGDMYVNGVLTGGELFGVLMMTSTSEREKSALSAKLRASGQFGLWGAELSSEVQKTVDSAVQSTRVDVFVQSSGYVPPRYPAKPEELLELAREFPAKVRETGQGVPYAVDLMEYRFLSDLPAGPNLFDLQNRNEVIQYAANIKAKAISQRSTVEFIRANLDIYPTANQQSLEQYVHDINAFLDRLHQAMSSCLNDHRACSFDRTNLVLPVIQLPPAISRPLPMGLDAIILWPNGKVYFLKGSQYVRYTTESSNEGIDPGYPAPIQGNWRGLAEAFPVGVDAAVMWPNGKAYFFKGNQYVRYTVAPQEGVDPGYPQPIKGNWPGLAEAFPLGIDAAIVCPNDKAYFFKGNQYVQYNLDPSNEGVEPGYPKSIEGNWPGLAETFPNGIDTAVAWPNGKIYFFKGDQYVRYTMSSQQNGVDTGYPQRIGGKIE